MNLVELTAVAQEALPLVAFREHLRLGSGFTDDDLQDDLLETYLRAALAAIEARTGKILIERDFAWTVTAWRDPARQPVPVAPLSAVGEITLIDATGAETVRTEGFTFAPDAQRPSLVPTGAVLPAIPNKGAARMTLLAGFGPDFNDLPSDLAQAVLMLAAHFYEYRHEVAMAPHAMPYGVSALIDRYRTVRLMIGGQA